MSMKNNHIKIKNIYVEKNGSPVSMIGF